MWSGSPPVLATSHRTTPVRGLLPRRSPPKWRPPCPGSAGGDEGDPGDAPERHTGRSSGHDARILATIPARGQGFAPSVTPAGGQTASRASIPAGPQASGCTVSYCARACQILWALSRTHPAGAHADGPPRTGPSPTVAGPLQAEAPPGGAHRAASRASSARDPSPSRAANVPGGGSCSTTHHGWWAPSWAAE